MVAERAAGVHSQIDLPATELSTANFTLVQDEVQNGHSNSADCGVTDVGVESSTVGPFVSPSNQRTYYKCRDTVVPSIIPFSEL